MITKLADIIMSKFGYIKIGDEIHQGKDFQFFLEIDGNGKMIQLPNDRELFIHVHGDCDNVKSTNGDIWIEGSVDTVQTTNGDVTVMEDVQDVTTTNGDITTRSILNNIKTKNGSINIKKV